MINKLVVLPTQETKDLLYARFSDLPIVIDYDLLHVEIASSGEPIVPDLSRVYRALPGTMGIWYESTHSARSWIILPLIPSPEMCARREEIGDVWGRTFIPHLALSDNFNNTSKVKPRLNSISTGLTDTLPELRFSCETVIEVANSTPDQADFHLDYTRTGLVNRKTFLELSSLSRAQS